MTIACVRHSLGGALTRAFRRAALASFLLYPFVVYVGLRYLQPRALALLLFAFFGGRRLSKRAAGPRIPEALAGRLTALTFLVGAVLPVELLFDAGQAFLFLPLLINLGLLLAFGETLLHPPSLVESIARISIPELTAEHIRYCRRVTLAWCGFFIVNASVSLVTATTCSIATWTLYNGLVSYALVGLVFLAEITYRSWRFRTYTGGLLDPLFRRLFPPVSNGR